MIAIDLSTQQALDTDPRAIQQINFTANLEREGNTSMFFIIEKAKETDRTSHSTYYLPKVEVKDYSVMIDGRNLFD